VSTQQVVSQRSKTRTSVFFAVAKGNTSTSVNQGFFARSSEQMQLRYWVNQGLRKVRRIHTVSIGKPRCRSRSAKR